MWWFLSLAFVPSVQSQELLAQSGSELLHAPPLGYFYAYAVVLLFGTSIIVLIIRAVSHH